MEASNTSAAGGESATASTKGGPKNATPQGTMSTPTDKKQQRAPRSGRSRDRPRNKPKTQASTEDGPAAAQAASQENETPGGESGDKRRNNNRRNNNRNSAAAESNNQSSRKRDIRNVFGDAIIEPEQIRDTVIEQAVSTFLDASAMHGRLENKSSDLGQLLRVHERVCEINDRFGIMDFQLKAKSRQCKDADSAYFQVKNNLAVWNNVRDGNTLLLEYNPDEDNRLQNVTFLRQGLPKFFNLSADAVSEGKRSVLPRDPELAYYHYDTLAQVKKALMEGSQVEVLRSLKTNGDGAHVTWSTILNAWVITSQNVSIVARDEREVKTCYPEQTRYFLARKIALCWMRKIKAIEQNDASKMDALKSDLAEHVFIGDFIGNPELINLIKYPRETICFHSVMLKQRTAENAKNTTYCLPNSFNFLSRHPIDVTPNRVIGVYENYDQLCTSLAEIHKQVANSSLSASEEGAVLTFIRRNPENSSIPDSVISMCKVKSVEYQALKLLVQLLQGAVEAGNIERQQDSLFTQYVKDFKSFSKSIDQSLGSHPETFYIDLFSTAFTMIAKKSNKKDKEMYQDLIYSDTVKFLVLVLNTNEEKNQGSRYVGQIDLESTNLSEAKLFSGEMMQQQSKPKKTASFKPTPKDNNNILGEVMSPQEPPRKTKQNQKSAESAASAATPTPEDSKRKGGRGKNAAKSQQQPTAINEEKTKPSRPSSTNINITALVVPPYSIKKQYIDRIKDQYHVIESAQLNVVEVEQAMKKLSKSQKVLVVLSSLDDITNQSNLCNLKLYAYKCSDAHKREPDSNFYGDDKDSYYAHSSFKNLNTAGLIRKEVEKMVKVANSSNLIHLVNPARLHVSNEDDLMVVLQLQDPPSLDVSIDHGEEQKQQEPVKKEQAQPNQAAQTPKQAASKAQQKKHKSIKRQETPRPVDMKVVSQEATHHLPTQEKKHSQIIVVFPIGIPGMGKTHFAEGTLQSAFEGLGLDARKNLHIIQNDQIRKQCLDKFLKANPGKSKQEGVKATAAELINLFKQRLNEKLLQLSKKKSNDLQMIYLDKNYPPSEIKITLDAINEHEANQSAKIRRVALVPDSVETQDFKDFPFSMNFLVQCYIRCLEREDHVTIQNEDPQRLLKLLVLFFQQFKGTQLNQSFQEDHGFDNLIKARFTMEHKDIELPRNLGKAIRKVVNSSSVQEVDQHIGEVVRLITLYRNLFGGKYSEACNLDNKDLLNESLAQFNKEFLAAKLAQEESEIYMLKSQNSVTPMPNADPFTIGETIDEETHNENDEEASNDENSGANNQIKPSKKSQEKDDDDDFDFMQEFQQTQSKAQKKKQQSQAKAVAQKPVAVKAVAPSTYKPKGNMANNPRSDDGFETVGASKQQNKKRRFSDSYDSESDMAQTPNMLLIKLNPDRQDLSQRLIDALQTIPKTVMNSTLTDNIQSIQELLTTKNCFMRGGWEHPNEFSLVCMQVGRDEDVFEESQIAQDFTTDKPVMVSCSALLLAPGKIIVGIASVDDQDVEEKVPFVSLLVNDFKHRNQITNFVRNACQNRGPFSSQIQTLRTGGKINEKQKFKSSSVNMGRDLQPVTAHLITLDEPIEMPGRTFIQY